MPPNYRQPDQPLARHERRGAWAMVAVVVVAAGAVGIWEVAGASIGAAPKGPCVTLTMASATGGGQVRYCGADARKWCAEEAAASGTIAVEAQAACRKKHLLAGD